MQGFVFTALMVVAVLTASPVFADSFGQRFGNEAPFALRDTLDPSTVIYIEPASGAEDTAEMPADQPRDVEGRVYPSEGASIEVRSEGKSKISASDN